MAAAPGAAQPLTARRLKALSGEFDLGNIVTLRAPAASALGDLGRCIHLQQLDLSQTPAAVLAPSAVLPPVPAAPADPAAGATVAEHPFAALQQLESLRLDRCGLVSLDFVPPLPKLTHLSVVGNALATVEALAPLIDERRFPALARIDIQTIDGILSNPGAAPRWPDRSLETHHQTTSFALSSSLPPTHNTRTYIKCARHRRTGSGKEHCRSAWPLWMASAGRARRQPTFTAAAARPKVSSTSSVGVLDNNAFAVVVGVAQRLVLLCLQNAHRVLIRLPRVLLVCQRRSGTASPRKTGYPRPAALGLTVGFLVSPALRCLPALA